MTRCIIFHPTTPEFSQELKERIAYCKKIGDTRGVESISRMLNCPFCEHKEVPSAEATN